MSKVNGADGALGPCRRALRSFSGRAGRQNAKGGDGTGVDHPPKYAPWTRQFSSRFSAMMTFWTARAAAQESGLACSDVYKGDMDSERDNVPDKYVRVSRCLTRL
jgi:hypothetical protein